MKAVDRILQRWRLVKVRPYLPRGARVLDLGCADGALYKHYRSQVSEVVGIDPLLTASTTDGGCRFIAGRFPDAVPEDGQFDAITMLAVLEHVPLDEQAQWAAACARFLKPGGHLVITVPSQVVDQILSVLKFLRLIDGMSLEEHYGFDPKMVPALFGSPSLRLVEATTFQLGCNNLFVFRAEPSASPRPS